jgi:hypothetical protein
MIWRWIAVACLLAIGLWFANLTLFNWWAAGGPPTPHPERFATRGNAFFFATCGFLLAAVFLAVMNYRRMKGPK